MTYLCMAPAILSSFTHDKMRMRMNKTPVLCHDESLTTELWAAHQIREMGEKLA